MDLAKGDMFIMFKSLFFATDGQNNNFINAYTSSKNREEIKTYLKKYDNVIDIIVTESTLTDIQSEGRQRLAFYMEFDAICLEGSKAVAIKDGVYITLVRNEHGRTQLLDDGVKTNCSSCGAPVDVYNQETCSYCQTGLHRDELFWRIESIKPGPRPKYIDNQRRGIIDVKYEKRSSLFWKIARGPSRK